MLNWLFNTQDQSYESYKLWQDKQPQSHFITSQLHAYIYPKSGYKDPHVRYTFGDFENLIYMPEQCNEFSYFNLLLNMYDKCKGYLRSLKGDHEGITLLRKVITVNNSDELYNHDFTKYEYPYQYLHGHTIAYFSLSTLILFFVSNYMHYKSYRSDRFPHIHIDICKNAYHNKVYGDIAYVPSIKSSKSITIPAKSKEKEVVKVCQSWPNMVSTTNKCTNCSRICDNFWGNHKSCLDCHLYKVCFVCGGLMFTIGKNGHPLCILHQNDN